MALSAPTSSILQVSCRVPSLFSILQSSDTPLAMCWDIMLHYNFSSCVLRRPQSQLDETQWSEMATKRQTNPHGRTSADAPLLTGPNCRSDLPGRPPIFNALSAED
jgi:hypothetical protein